MSEPTAPGTAATGDRILRRSMRVVALRNGWACLESPRDDACGGCAGKTACAGAALADLAGPRRAWLPVGPAAAARVGAEVDVALRGGAFLWASFLAYLLPPAALALAAALATAAGWSDVATAAVCLPVLLLALVPVWLAGRGGRIWRELRIEQPPSGRP